MSNKSPNFFDVTKGQLILKADWHAIDSPKKQMDGFVSFAFLLFTTNKSNTSVRFLGESMACQSAFRFYLTFSGITDQGRFKSQNLIVKNQTRPKRLSFFKDAQDKNC